jgi:hypothetical protein
MPAQVGTYDVSTLLASRFTSANAFGLTTIAEVLQADLAAHNTIVTEMLSDLADPTTDVQRIYGSSSGGAMVKVDEYGRSATQRVTPGSTVGFPLERFQYPVGWTKRYFEKATVGDLVQKEQAAKKAHLYAIRQEIKRAIYTATNATFADFLINGVSVGVKRFLNADSSAIPEGPDGGTFTASSHTHYTGAASLSATNLSALIANVIEHGHGNRIIAAINFNDVATVIALSGFVAAPDYRTVPATNATVTMETTNPANQYNRYLGVFGAAEVWVKPWAIQNYIFVYDAADDRKPLAFRQDAVGAPLQGLRMAAELDTHPLYTQYFEADFGIGVWTRTNGAVLYFANATYASPTITL